MTYANNKQKKYDGRKKYAIICLFKFLFLKKLCTINTINNINYNNYLKGCFKLSVCFRFLLACNN